MRAGYHTSRGDDGSIEQVPVHPARVWGGAQVDNLADCPRRGEVPAPPCYQNGEVCPHFEGCGYADGGWWVLCRAPTPPREEGAVALS
jgi:hypothetical protein